MIYNKCFNGINYFGNTLQVKMSRTFSQRSDFVDFDDGFEQEERENDGDSFEENIRKQLLEFRSGTERGNIFSSFVGLFFR